jgi:hypothetical protein
VAHSNRPKLSTHSQCIPNRQIPLLTWINKPTFAHQIRDQSLIRIQCPIIDKAEWEGDILLLSARENDVLLTPSSDIDIVHIGIRYLGVDRGEGSGEIVRVVDTDLESEINLELSACGSFECTSSLVG